MPYGTVEGLEEYAEATGRELPDDANLTAALYNASLYIDGVYWDDFCGEPASLDAAFPRKGAGGVIPQRVINAAYEAAIQWIFNPDALSVGGSAGGQVIREKVDVIEVAYASPTGDFLADGTPLYSTIEGLLKPYLCRAGEGTGGWAFVV